MKIDWITSWHEDELFDTQVISNDYLITGYLEEWVTTGNSYYRNRLEEHLISLALQHSYFDILIVHRDNELLMSANDTITRVDPVIRPLLELAFQDDGVHFSDFYLQTESDAVVINYISRIGNSDHALVLSIDPYLDLLPQIESWPMISNTSETAIFRIDEWGIKSLSAIKHVESIEIPQSDYDLYVDRPIVEIAQGLRGFFRGTDYKGVDVISYSDEVPGTNWVLSSKTDISEIFADLNNRIALIIVITIVLILLSITGISLIYRTRQRDLFRHLYHREKELRSTQIKVAESLKEKEVLLSEVHHRVKNNLAIISSLLQLEAYNIKDPLVQESLFGSVLRIQSMAMIHEMLYKYENFSKIPLDNYLRKLGETISELYKDKQNARLELNLVETDIKISQAIPLALIVTECITNSYKHAFSDTNNPGLIFISTTLKQDVLAVQIGDNGQGLNDLEKIMNSDSLGISLIHNLTSQLNGTLDIQNDGGLRITLKFTLEKV
jgi:two-component sensor histidine kinase